MELDEIEIHALHGFLGLPSDWRLPLAGFHIQLYDIFRDFPICSFCEWAELFNSSLKSQRRSKKRVLLGYSLGGRLAMHVLLQNPQGWDCAIFVSSHPGLKCENEKVLRKVVDDEWANRFEVGEWNALIKEWNDQPVLAHNAYAGSRNESEFSRRLLADSLRIWSLGNQKDLTSLIESVDCPILWIAGQCDRKYARLADQMVFLHKNSKKWVANDSGHRVPWELPSEFRDSIYKYLEGI